MTLTNYWLPLLWMFIGGGFLSAIAPRRRTQVLGKVEFRWDAAAAFALVLPLILWAGFRNNAFGDTGVYRGMFRDAPSDLAEFGSYVGSANKDKGFNALMILFKVMISESDKTFFLAVAAVQLLCLMSVFRKLSPDYWMSIFFFVASCDYFSWCFNGMRQFLAVALIFACLPLMMQRRYVATIAVILLASTIHATALLMLPFLFVVQGRPWNARTVLFILGVLLVTLFLDRFTGFVTSAMENTQYKDEIEQFVEDDGVNIIRVAFYGVPTILSLVFRRRLYNKPEPVMDICTNLSIVSTGFYFLGFLTSGILVGRIPIFFSLANYILLPWMVDKVLTRESARMVKAVLIAVYVGYFYFQMGITWGAL